MKLYTQKEYKNATRLVEMVWDLAEEVRFNCMQGTATEQEVDEAYEKAKKASAHAQHVYENLDPYELLSKDTTEGENY